MPDNIYQADQAEVVAQDELTTTAAATKETALQDGAAKSPEERIVPRRPRTETNTTEIDSTIVRPGSVRINVKGAFIVDTPEGSPTRNGGSPQGSSSYETKDIRLPNHTAIVSHIAVDVSADRALPARSPFAATRLLLTRLPTIRSVVLWPNLFTSPAKRTRRSLAAGSTSSTLRPIASTTVSSS